MLASASGDMNAGAQDDRDDVPHFATAKSGKDAQGDADSNFSHYYRHVRVCDKCFMVYTTLDKAREQTKASSPKPVHKPAKAKASQRKAAASERRAKEEEKEQSRQSPPANVKKRKKKSIKVSREESRKKRAEPGMQSFEDLDGYLRGKQRQLQLASTVDAADSRQADASGVSDLLSPQQRPSERQHRRL